jgi:tetratricopeptide (TPR) repeat protein
MVDPLGVRGLTGVAMRVGLLILVTLAVSCGGARRQVTELDPVEFKVDKQADAGKRVYMKDFAALVEEASAKMAAGEAQEAARLYDLAAKEFPQNPGLFAVRYNAGLSWLQAARADMAAERFGEAMKLAAGTRHARDALFLLAEALDGAGRPLDAAAVYHGALHDSAVQGSIGGPLGLLDELEAHAREGIARRKGGDLPGADDAFKRVERLYGEHRDVQLVTESEWVARSLYERGEVYRTLFNDIRFKLPVARMKRDLEDKALLFLKAESAYFRGVRLHHRQWSLASGFEIGHLYTRLIEDIENAEVPEEVTGTVVEEYRDELWNHMERLAKRSVVIYRKNIELAQRLGEASSDWVKRSEEGLVRMEELIATATGRRARLMLERGATPATLPTSDNPQPGPLGKGRRTPR